MEEQNIHIDLSDCNLTKIKDLPHYLQQLDMCHNNVTKIESLPNTLQILKLSNNQIKKIENLRTKDDEPDSLLQLHLSANLVTKIENLPNSIQELWLDNNYIITMDGFQNTLQKLYLHNNHITHITNLPNSLQKLDLQYNRISKIANLPNSLRELYLSHNLITKIENLPNLMQIVSLKHNQIKKIENLPSSLRILNLHNNQIEELPIVLLELVNLREFYHHGNPIEYRHQLVERWINRFNINVNIRNNNNNNNKVYSDGQNIHASSIQSSFRNSLENLLKDKDVLSPDECKQYVLECNELEEQTKRELINYCDDATEHGVYLVTFEEVFRYVISRIVKHSERNELLKILNEEIKYTICKCFTGRMTRLVNILNGFYDDITIQIGSNEQISNIIIMLKDKYEGNELVKQVRLEMEERDYDEKVIEEWLTYVEE